MKKVNYSNNIIKNRISIFLIISILLFFVIIISLYNIMISKNNYYSKKLLLKTSKVYISKKGPRGNIYDRNGELLVGNKEIVILVYQKPSAISLSKELELIDILIDNIDFPYEKISKKDLLNYYYVINREKLKKNLPQTIINNYLNRIIDEKEYNNEIMNLISDDDLEKLNDHDKKIAYIFNKMNNGFTYSTKTIKDSLTTEELNFYNDNKKKLNGFTLSIKYERMYPYNEVFRPYLGNVGLIPEKELNYYIEKGYNRNDLVGISYLEKEYEEILKGKDETYKLLSNGEKVILTEAEKGNDIYLTIDIKLQKEIEHILKEEVKRAKKESNTKYYNKSYIILSNPKTGEIYAASGQGIIKKGNQYKNIDYLTDLSNSSFTPGSIVKGASHLVGYSENVIKIGTTMKDSCIKLKNVDKKCSWKSLGIIDDVGALKWSSNYYQYMIAIKVGNGKYKYNQNLNINEKAFEIYRNVFKSFGLGSKTEIDLPKESIGFIGSDKSSLSLLSFPIGQYDTYTPMQLLQYINTIANSGKRTSLHFLYKSDDIFETQILNSFQIDKKYMDRVKMGFRSVMNGGTGTSYINKKYKAAGKTGTAQNFIDTNNDSKVDTMTITTTFGAYMPYNDPKLSIVIVSPNISDRKTSYTSKINKRLSKKITDLFFNKYQNKI